MAIMQGYGRVIHESWRHLADIMQPKPSIRLYGFRCLMWVQQALISFWFVVRIEAEMGWWVSGLRVNETGILRC